jgi:hypothetical protein
MNALHSAKYSQKRLQWHENVIHGVRKRGGADAGFKCQALASNMTSRLRRIDASSRLQSHINVELVKVRVEGTLSAAQHRAQIAAAAGCSLLALLRSD